jgi:tyrosine kinase 3
MTLGTLGGPKHNHKVIVYRLAVIVYRLKLVFYRIILSFYRLVLLFYRLELLFYRIVLSFLSFYRKVISFCRMIFLVCRMVLSFYRMCFLVCRIYIPQNDRYFLQNVFFYRFTGTFCRKNFSTEFTRTKHVVLQNDIFPQIFPVILQKISFCRIFLTDPAQEAHLWW